MMRQHRGRTFLFSYEHAGARYSFQVPAETADEARERVSRMQCADFDGELVAELPLAAGWLAPLVCSIRNLWTRAARKDRPSPLS